MFDQFANLSPPTCGGFPAAEAAAKTGLELHRFLAEWKTKFAATACT